MKKYLLFFICINISFSFAFSQARTNAELPIISDTGRELKNITGWVLSPEGQWISRKNRIPVKIEAKHNSLIDEKEWGLGIDTIERLKLYIIKYNNNEYYLLEKRIIDGKYFYPNIREGWSTFIKNYYYIIEKENFVINLIKDKKNLNNIKIYNITNDNKNNDINTLANIIEPHIRNKNSNDDYYDFYRIEKLNNLIIYTYLFTEENVVRFFFNHGFSTRDNGREKLTTMPDNYYFECELEHFNSFFQPIIN